MRTSLGSSLGAKLNALTISLVLVTAVGIGGFSVWEVLREESQELRDRGVELGEIIAQNAQYAIYTENPDALRQIIQLVSQTEELAYVVIWNAAGEVLARETVDPERHPPPPRRKGQPPRPGRARIEEHAGREAGLFDVLVSVPRGAGAGSSLLFSEIGQDTAPETIGYVQIGISRERIDRRIERFFRSTLAFTALLVLASVGLTLWMTRRIADPVRRLARVSRAVSDGDLDHEIDVRSEGEIGELSRSFGVMLDRLRSYRAEVEDHQRTLEEKVELRTRELREATHEAYEYAQKAEAASEAKSQFLANMSHEIRTPMNGVLGMGELLLNTELSAKQRRFAETVRRSAETLLELINDILDFSKMEAGKLELDLIDCDLREIAEDVVELLAEHAHRKGLEIACVVAEDVPDCVRADPSRLRQVLTNLIGNAIKFTEEGEVVLRLSCIRNASGAPRVRFRVADTGIGIASGVSDGLFDAFRQADASTTRRYGGTGLGLAIRRQLVDLMGGDIRVESEPGRGSTFTFDVSFEIARCRDRGPRHVANELRGLRVLSVDDNATNREIVEHQLAAWGMRCDSVASGSEALEALEAMVRDGERYDLAIIDYHMPGMDGLELARAIQADRSLAGLPLVMLTSVSVEEIDEVRGAGIVTHVSKPVRQSHLFDCMTEALGVHHPPVLEPGPRRPLEPRGFAARVLLVEDNPINQDVAVAMLEGLGCTVETAGDGGEAVRRLGAASYDLVLMDCHMPEMDGLEATRRIRSEEASTGRSPTPIVALTANAMEGDREACLAAGMDDYLSKPFGSEDLEGVLGRWLEEAAERAGDEAGSPLQEPAVQPDAPAIDSEALAAIAALQRADAPDLLLRVIDTYLAAAPELIAAMEDAAARQDAHALERAAHTLKSSSAQVGARRVADACRAVEELARRGSVDGVRPLLSDVVSTFEPARAELLDAREART